MIVDFDDFHETNHRLDLLEKLKEANPLFRCTLFTIPGKCREPFLDDVPNWCQIAVHGWSHPDSYECSEWTYEKMERVVNDHVVREYFCRGFKAPGWQISDDCYLALRDNGWWVADQPYNDKRRPLGIRVHRLGDGDHWHGHIQNVEGNGLEERFEELLARVEKASHFEWISEAVQRW